MKYPNFYFENELWKKGLTCVAGCDEVGRGCFAGPVVAGVCVFSPSTLYTLRGLPLEGIKIDDSKKLNSLQREKAGKWIRRNCLAFGVGVGNIAEINKFGIKRATNSAFRRAVYNANKTLSERLDYLLIDAFYVPYIRGIRVPNSKQKARNKKLKDNSMFKFYANQLAIEKGDQKSLSIAAASIIAKVYRDNLMIELSQKYKKYGWDKNKGYGTKEHQKAIIEHGLTRYHRKTFVEAFIMNSSFSQALSET